MKKYLSKGCLFSLLLLCVYLANGSESAHCIFGDKDGAYYSVNWDIDYGPDGIGSKQFNVRFYQMCGRDEELLSSSAPHFVTEKESRFADKINYIAEDEDKSRENLVTVEGIEALSYAASINFHDQEKNKPWWWISSNDHTNEKWTIHFNYPDRKFRFFHEVKTSDAVCEIKYSSSKIRIANITPPLTASIYLSRSSKYVIRDIAATSSDVAILTRQLCNLL